uniref:Uncharacterized protein n=1 Tax=Brassica oleracea var. oleracea TaxID=109376 RepID=A0A0D3ASJ0_BRAOL
MLCKRLKWKGMSEILQSPVTQITPSRNHVWTRLELIAKVVATRRQSMPLGGFLMEKRGKPPSDYSSSKITPVEVKGCVTALPALQAPESTKPGPDYYAGITYVASLGIYVPRSKRDELVLKLAPSVNC